MTYPADVQRRMYALMVLMKAADDRLSKGIGTGEFMCVYWPSRGQEAIAAAMGVSLRRDDQLVTTYRGLHDLIGKGVPLEEIYGEMMGRTVGASRGKGGTMHIAKPGSGRDALDRESSAPDRRSASGWRWRPSARGSTGSRWSASATARPTPARSTRRRTWPRSGTCRWSSCARTTMYAEMTPTPDTMKLEHVADRAAGYGMPGVRVDGNDPLAVADGAGRGVGQGAPTVTDPPSSSA